jgi:hypothetical protein
VIRVPPSSAPADDDNQRHASGEALPSTNGTLTYTITGNATTGQATGYTGQVIYTS